MYNNKTKTPLNEKKLPIYKGDFSLFSKLFRYFIVWYNSPMLWSQKSAGFLREFIILQTEKLRKAGIYGTR